MRGYAKIVSSFWREGTGKSLRGDVESQLVALYLMSSPHASMTGIYYLPIPMLAHETGLPIEGASKGLRRLIEAGFVHHHEGTDMVFVTNFARVQIGDRLAPADKQRVAVVRQLRELGDHPFVGLFVEKYGENYALLGEFAISPKPKTEGPLKGLRRGSEASELRTENRELRTEEKYIVDSGASPELDGELSEPQKVPTSKASEVREVFDAWRSKLEHPSAKLDAKRHRAVEARLREGYTVAELVEAVEGCAASAWHRGQNDRGVAYDDLELICRNASKVDMFRALASGARPALRRTDPSPHTDFDAIAVTDAEIDRLWKNEGCTNAA
jgi:hypothetical protein